SALRGWAPAALYGLRPELAGARRTRVRRGRAAHLLQRRDARALRRRREARRRGSRPRSGERARLVVLRAGRRPSARAAATEEDGRPARDVLTGLRRSDGADERLGSRGARALPRRSVRRGLPRRLRPDRDPRGARESGGAAARGVAPPPAG